jgi:hypothetical protein
VSAFWRDVFQDVFAIVLAGLLFLYILRLSREGKAFAQRIFDALEDWMGKPD